MGKRWSLAAILTLFSSMALAQHAVPLEPDTAPVAAPAAPIEATPESDTVASESSAPAPVAAAAVPEPEPAPAPQITVQASYPSEVDVYLVPAAMRQVCTTGEWGFNEIRTDCRTEPVPVRRLDPALRGLCVTRYGQRTCY
jgi:hypothetical protein